MTKKTRVLDHKCSKVFKEYMEEENETFQLMPPHLHRRNTTERAIQTFKNHFRTISFQEWCQHTKISPVHLWCRLFPQAIVTLNLLRPSSMNTTLSAHAQLHGLFDFNVTPFAPLGTKVIVHLKPTIRKRWAPRGQDGWYINRSKDHYCCYNIYITETRAVIQPDTVEFILHNSKMPF